MHGLAGNSGKQISRWWRHCFPDEMTKELSEAENTDNQIEAEGNSALRGHLRGNSDVIKGNILPLLPSKPCIVCFEDTIASVLTG